jgi:hypothetical protein
MFGTEIRDIEWENEMTAIGHTVPELPRLRITGRGRAVLAALIAIPLAFGGVALGLNAGGAVATGQAAGDSFTWVTLSPGQSLWELAEEIAPTADPREFVADLVALNQLPSADVQPGQRLALPAEYAH